MMVSEHTRKLRFRWSITVFYNNIGLY